MLWEAPAACKGRKGSVCILSVFDRPDLSKYITPSFLISGFPVACSSINQLLQECRTGLWGMGSVSWFPHGILLAACVPLANAHGCFEWPVRFQSFEIVDSVCFFSSLLVVLGGGTNPHSFLLFISGVTVVLYWLSNVVFMNRGISFIGFFFSGLCVW